MAGLVYVQGKLTRIEELKDSDKKSLTKEQEVRGLCATPSYHHLLTC
jgi:hypothetical protein